MPLFRAFKFLKTQKQNHLDCFKREFSIEKKASPYKKEK